MAADSPKGRTLHRLVREGCALFTAHTNADAPGDGVNESLALALGIVDPAVIAPEGDGDASATVNKIVTFAPHEDAGRIRDAMTAAGAGRIGDYDSCTFTVEGEGRFRPLDGATPAVGRVGEVEVVAESRIEAVVPRDRRDAVVAALRAVHPYEEPAYDVLELVTPPQGRPTRGHGRIGRLAEPTTLRGFAEQVRRALPETARGPGRGRPGPARGDRRGDQRRRRLPARHRARHRRRRVRHLRPAAPPGGEFLEHGGPSLVDVAHWSAEWTWLPVVEGKLLERLAERGDTVDTHVSTTCTDPWTFRL